MKIERWIGMATIITGFCEMSWWAKPSFRVFGGVPEFETLLTNKLIFSAITWGILVAIWLLRNRILIKKK